MIKSPERPSRCGVVRSSEIMAMPMAYNTLVGDMGSSLCGGQKQRVLLARALYRQPRILFLNEGTTHTSTWRTRDRSTRV